MIKHLAKAFAGLVVLGVFMYVYNLAGYLVVFLVAGLIGYAAGHIHRRRIDGKPTQYKQLDD